MGKLFGKKGDEGDEDSKRSALFGGRSKNSKSPNPAAQENPYANIPSQSDAYTQAKARSGAPGYPQPQESSRRNQPSGYGGPPNGYPDQKSGGSGGGYGADRYGSQGGYGSRDRYGPSSDPPGAGSQMGRSQGTGGYGGLGPAPSQQPDENRDALFGGARERVEKQNQQSMGYGRDGGYGGGQDGDGGYGGGSQSYGAYGDRQLTAEEEEEEDVTATKQQMKFIKQEDVSSTRNALRLAAQAEESGMNTLARIGAQGERIHNTEKNLDLTANHNRIAEEKAKELKHLNRSMFAVRVANPFTSSARQQQRDLDILEKHRIEREEREISRREGFDTDQRMQKTFKELYKEDPNSTQNKKASLAERAKYQFEADSEDDEMENEIDNNLNALGSAAGRLNNLARATGKEVDEQNRHLERINAKSTKVDDQIALNRARLDRFH